MEVEPYMGELKISGGLEEKIILTHLRKFLIIPYLIREERVKPYPRQNERRGPILCNNMDDYFHFRSLCLIFFETFQMMPPFLVSKD